MVKRDLFLPSICVVAGIAGRVQLSLVNVVCLVTIMTLSSRSSLKGTFLMAIGARYVNVTSGQVELSVFVMIERYLIPFNGWVTIIAERAHFSFMDIVGSMAINTLDTGTFPERETRVTGVTAELGVSVFKNKLCFSIMVKNSILPVFAAVASIAFFLRAAVVNVVHEMTGIALA